MATEEEIAAARAAQVAAEQAALKTAEDAATKFREVAAAESAKVVALEQRLAALEAAKAAPAPELKPEPPSEFARMVERDRNDARMRHVRAMGLDNDPPAPGQAPRLTEAQILNLIPNIDPRDPDGPAKFEEFRAKHPGMFKSKTPTQESMIEATRIELSAKKSGLFSGEALHKSVFGGGR